MSYESESDNEYLDEMMNVNFPLPSSSDGEDTNEDLEHIVPFIDVLSGWDNYAVDRCLRIALGSYNISEEMAQIEFEPQPNTQLSPNGKSVVALNSYETNEEVKTFNGKALKDISTKDEDYDKRNKNIFQGWKPKSFLDINNASIGMKI